MPWSDRTRPLSCTTRIWGLLYVFVELGVLSLFDTDGHRPDQTAMARLLHGHILWSFVILVSAAGCIWHGLAFSDAITKGFGITALAASLLVDFFGLCWSWMRRATFFAVLAGLLALLGRYAEVIWTAAHNYAR